MRNGRTLELRMLLMAQRNELVKGLGLYGATSVVAGTMIGTAIFLVPSDMLRAVGTPLLVLAVWIFAGVLSLFGALGYAELGAAIPEAGGEYVTCIAPTVRCSVFSTAGPSSWWPSRPPSPPSPPVFCFILPTSSLSLAA